MTTQLVLTQADGTGYEFPRSNVHFRPALAFEGSEVTVESVSNVDSVLARRLAKAVAAGEMAPSFAYDSLVWAEEDYPGGCECELDFNCYLHQGQYTALERKMDEWAKQDVSPYPWDA